MTTKYVPCAAHEIPAKVRFDVPGQNQGQIIEVAYGGFGAAEHGDGDDYKRVHDRSIGPAAITYYRAVEA